MTGDYPNLIADTFDDDDMPPPVDTIADAPEPFNDLISKPAESINDLIPDHLLVQRTASPQTWNISIAEAKYHWYDLVTGFPEMPDIRDPVGRHLRRMQFDLEATMEKRLIYFVVNRPLVRFDEKRSTSWSFFGLKLTIPVLVGADRRDTLTIDLEVPFAATLKKPTVSLTDRFITLNWGGLIEALSIHDVLQNYESSLEFNSKIQYLGQTRDPLGRLAKARLAAVAKIHRANSEDNDMLLLIQRMNVEVLSDEGDPADLPANQNAISGDLLLKERMDVVECALIRYFEGPKPPLRTLREMEIRRDRLIEVQELNKLGSFRIDLRLLGAGNYHDLVSSTVPVSRAHIIDCDIVAGEVIVTRVKPPEKGK
jgi:hypothetical protein